MAMSPCSASQPWNARSRLPGTLRVEVTLQGPSPHCSPVDGTQCDSSPGELLAIVEAYEAAVLSSKGVSTARHCRRCMSKVALPAMSCPTRPWCGSTIVSPRSIQRGGRGPRAFCAAPALEDGDTVEVTDLSPAARPGLGDPLIEALVERNGLEVRAKLGWTDVAFLRSGVYPPRISVLATTIAHTQGEYVERAWVVDTHAALLDVITNGV